MATTLKDVAHLARVSVKTVSNVVNDRPHVSEHVRRRVENAIHQLGYRPDPAARALRSGRTGLLALVLPSVGAPCPTGLVDEVVWHANRYGFRVVVDLLGSGGRPAAGLRVDATLVCADAVPPDLADAQDAHQAPLIVLADGPDERHDRVAPDTIAAARDATEHLLGIGRRRIAAIGVGSGELLGYLDALRQAGLDPPVGPMPTTARQSRPDGYRAARGLLAQDRHPDAVLCGTDRLAASVLRAAADAGLRVPDDLAVIGTGDTEEGRYSRPTLTTVATDPALIAHTALDLVIRRLDRPGAGPTRIVVPHVVLPRESTGPAGAGPRTPVGHSTINQVDHHCGGKRDHW
jgi:DNA-binding LacI/PurR family transcriptional regulator